MTKVHLIDESGTHCSWCGADLAGKWTPGEYLHVSETPDQTTRVSCPFDAKIGEQTCGKVLTICEDTGAVIATIHVPVSFTDKDADKAAKADTMGRSYYLQHSPRTVRLETQQQIAAWIKANLVE